MQVQVSPMKRVSPLLFKAFALPCSSDTRTATALDTPPRSVTTVAYVAHAVHTTNGCLKTEDRHLLETAIFGGILPYLTVPLPASAISCATAFLHCWFSCGSVLPVYDIQRASE